MDVDSTRILKINDIWHTVQGEGLHAGRRSLFIRMPYCNLACSWCDTQFNTYQNVSLADLVKFATKERTRFAVLTGGEPMMNKDSRHVIAMLKSLGFEIACETNGTFPILPGIDFVTVSPKSFSNLKFVPGPFKGAKAPTYPKYYVDPHAFESAHEFKYVVDKDFDFEILSRHDTKDGRRYSLSPEFNDFEANVIAITAFIAKNPDWRVSLQTHKWMGVP